MSLDQPKHRRVLHFRMSDGVNIDVRPWVVVDISGKVLEQDSKPAFVPDSPARWSTALHRCKGKQVKLRLHRPKLQRTLEQNAYLWAVVYADVLEGLRILAEQAGEPPVFQDEDELHEALKWKFLRRTVAGLGLDKLPSSAQLSIEEFSHYVDQVILWAAEHGIEVRQATREERERWAA